MKQISKTHVKLSGELGRKFGRHHYLSLDTHSPREAARALCATVPGFEQHIMTASQRGMAFALFRGNDDENIGNANLDEPAGREIRIAQVPMGSKSGLLQTVLGVALVATAVIATGGVGAAFGTAGWGTVASVGVSLAAGGVVQMLSPQPKLSANNNNGDKQSASYNFSGAVNTTAQGGPVPYGFGRMRVGSAVISAGIDAEDYSSAQSNVSTDSGTVTASSESSAVSGAKGGGGSSHTPVEAPDSLRSISYFKILDLLGEGEWVGLVDGLQSVYLNNTPIANADGSLNFERVTVVQRTGTQDQDYIQGFSDVENEISVATELKSSAPWTASLTNTDLSAVRITLSVDSLEKQNTSNGDINGYTIQYAIDVATDGGAFSTVLTSAFTGKTTSEYDRSHRIDLPTATSGWTIRVRRLTANANSTTIADTTRVKSYTEIIDAKLRYPNCALIGIMGDAEAFDNIPARAYDCKMRIVQVPSNYDPTNRTYSGTWDGTFKPAWTDNPAWCYYDLTTNDRFGLGNLVTASQVDKWSLYRISQYCDQLVSDGKGGQEPRFTCNVYLQQQQDAYQVLQDLASIFRGVSYWMGGQITPSADMPDDPVYTFDNSNVINGQFTYASSPRSSRYTTALVTWNDPSNAYAQTNEYTQYQDGLSRYGIRQQSITAFGCTSQGQAQRTGLWNLLTANIETETVTFQVGLDGMMAAPGQIIRIADHARAGARQGGRVVSATTTKITVDRIPDVVASGDTLTVNFPADQDGDTSVSMSQTRTIQSVSGNVITVSQAFSSAPSEQSVWTVESDDLKAQTFRVVSVSEDDDDSAKTFTITAAIHNASKFAAIDSGAIIQIPPVSRIPSGVQDPPTNVTIHGHTVITQGIATNVMTISWSGAKGAASYKVEYQRDNGPWVQAGTVTSTAIDVDGIYTGTYLARVTAFSVGGDASIPALSSATQVQGKTQPNPPPTLTAVGQNLAIALSWAWPSGVNVDDTSYTEIWVSETSTQSDGASAAHIAYPGQTYTIGGLLPSEVRYAWARLVDKAGNVGAWSNAVHASANDATELFKPIQDQVDQAQQDIDDAKTQIQQEVSDREAAVSQEISDREAAVSSVASDLAKEVTDRTNAISDATAAIQAVADDLTQEVSDREAAITAEATARDQAIQAQADAQSQALAQEAQARGAAITAEQTARQEADSSLSDRIDTNTAAIGSNTSAIQDEQTARVNADNAEANSRETLATQMRGDYDGTDLSQVSSGLIAAERDARSTQYESVVQQMSQLQAGVGEQFDYDQMWYFTSDVEGWAGVGNGAPTWSASWIKPVNSANGTGTGVTSPAGLAVNGNEYQQVRFRIRKTGNPDASLCNVAWRLPTDASSTWASAQKLNFPEPDYDDTGIGVVVLTMPWTGTIDQIRIVFGKQAASATDYWEIDWVAIGRPAPGASTAALNDEATARATADTAEVTARQQLSVTLTGVQDPTGKTLDQLPNGLLVDERNARADADSSQVSQINALQARMPSGTGKLATEADVTSEASTRADADSALSTRLDSVEATANNAATSAQLAAEEQARADGDSANATSISNLTAAVNQLPQWGSGFEAGTDFDQWNAASGSTIAPSTDAYTGSQSALVTSTFTDHPAANSLAVNVVTGAQFAAAAAGRRIRISVFAKQPSDNGASQFSVSYSTNDNGNSGWHTFSTTSGYAKYSFLYDVPVAAKTTTPSHTLRLLGDESGAGLGTIFDAVTIELVATENDLPEVSAAITGEATTRATADTALGQRIDSVEATANNAATSAQLTTEQQARVQGDQANATAIALLQSQSFANMIPDGGFEQQLRTLPAANWTYTSDAASGSVALQIAGGAFTSLSLNAGNVIPVVAGRTYTFSATWKATSDFNGTTNKSKLRIARQDNSVTSMPSISWTASDDYKTDVRTWTAPSDGSVTGLLINIFANNSAGTVTIDNVSMRDTTDVDAFNAAIQAEQEARTNGDSANAQQITDLQSSLSTTNDNVTAAQTAADNAAQAAADAAGIANGKGKVIIQSAAPAAADRLAQNLWIDTTGGANTPKRWNGSAWVAVTDKTATDAAAAAVAAQQAADAAQNKADSNAQAITGLQTSVTTQGNQITANAQDIEQLQTTVGANSAAIQTEQQARVQGDSALAEQFAALQAAAIDGPKFISAFQPGNDFNQWQVGTGHAIAAETDDVYQGAQSALISSTVTSPATSSTTVDADLSTSLRDIFSGKTVLVRVWAKAPASNASAEFAVAQNTGDIGNSGWHKFTPTSDWAAYEFTYAWPTGGSATPYVHFWGDTSGSGLGVLIGKVVVCLQSDDLKSSIATEAQARSDADGALSDQLTQLQATVGDNSTAITNEQTARSDADTALGQRIDSVEATANNAATQAQLQQEQTARADADSAIAQELALIGATNADKSAFIINSSTTQIDNDGTLAEVLSGLQASDGELGTRIDNEQQARIDGDAANAQAIESVQASIDTFVAVYSQTFNGSAGNWTLAGASIQQFPAGGGANYGALVISTGASQIDPQLLSPALKIGGTQGNVVRAMIRIRSASYTWQGQLYWTNTNHSSFSETYSKKAPDPGVAGRWVMVEWDVSDISDWVGDTTTSIRLDFQNSANTLVDVAWIGIGIKGDAVIKAQATQTFQAKVNADGTAYAQAAVLVDANGHIGGTVLSTDGTTSEFVVVADKFGVVPPSGSGGTQFANQCWTVLDDSGNVRVELGKLS